MAVMNVNPTRMELTRLKKRLVTAVRGHKLLKDKRDELMRRFLDLIRENKALREQVEAGIREANRHFVLASAVMQKEALDAALLTPKQEVGLEVSSRNVMSVDIPVFHTAPRTEEKGDSYPYGFAFTSFELDGAVEELAGLRRSQHVFLPQREEAACAEDYRQWRRAVERARDWVESV